jgi:hypothetical protein
MNSLAISAIAFACVFGGALFGMFLRSMLREHHLSEGSKEVIKLGVGLIATMSALVLGLLVASAKASFDTQRTELTQMAANLMLLDRVLAHYGPEAKEAREMLRGNVTRMIGQYWPTEDSRTSQAQPSLASEALYDKLQDLSPKNESQRLLQSQALKIAIDLGQTRWLLFAQKSSAISVPFLVVVIFWLTIIFGSFGLFAPRNLVVFATLIVCALSVSGALFLILELDRPFDGLIQISSEPLRNVLEQLGR